MFFSVILQFRSNLAIKQAAHENKEKGGSYPQWGASLSAWMHASENSEVCLRRGHCQPLGGKSTWASFGSVDSSKQTIFAMTQLDSNSFFHDLAIGADAHVSGVVAIIAAAQALSKVHT